MARRRRSSRRKNPLGEDLIVLGIGAAGGALAMYLYSQAVLGNAGTGTAAAALPAATPTPAAGS